MPRTPAQTAILAAVVALAFIEECKATFTTETLEEIRRRNAEPAYAGQVCATHDFVDANCLMEAAFVRLGLKVAHDYDDATEEAAHDASCDLWGAAWSIAKATFLTRGAPPVPPMTDLEEAALRSLVEAHAHYGVVAALSDILSETLEA